MSGRTLEFFVAGKPFPQGSKSAIAFCGQEAGFCKRCRKRHLVRFNQVESSAGLKPWRGTVTTAAKLFMARGGYFGDEPMFPGDVMLSAVFTFERPASHFGTGRNASTVKGSAPVRPQGARVGDLSKLVRAVEDSLTDAGVWHDDCQVTDFGTVAKTFPYGHHQARTVPGAWICVTDPSRGAQQDPLSRVTEGMLEL